VVNITWEYTFSSRYILWSSKFSN